VPGDQHTADVFGKAIDAAIASSTMPSPRLPAASCMVPFIDKAVTRASQCHVQQRDGERESAYFFVGADLHLQADRART
jgi:hypothetical protein